jgi:hypothetical protein
MNELQGAFLRRERAREHLPNLEAVVSTIVQTCESGVVAYEDPHTGHWGPSPMVMDPWRRRASMLAGEIVYNLRAALDYLIYVLATNDSGTPQSGTQFLIEDTQQGFTSRSKRYLKGLTDEHVAIVRQFQPFKGCHWTGLLRDLSNPDKHRELVSVDVDFNPTALLTITQHGPETDADGVPIENDVGMYLKGPALVYLPQQLPLIETLRELETQVGLVLALFSYEFPPG